MRLVSMVRSNHFAMALESGRLRSSSDIKRAAWLAFQHVDVSPGRYRSTTLSSGGLYITVKVGR